MKKLIALVLVMVSLLSLMALPALAESDWVTGNYGDGYTTVYLNSLANDGYIKLHTYYCPFGDHTGPCWGAIERNDTLLITFCDIYGNHLISFNAKGEDILYLGNDHTAYRIYISRADTPAGSNTVNSIINSVSNVSTHWAIETISNTRF